MARSLPKPCKFPGCPNLGCTIHGKQLDTRPTANQRGYTYRWQQVRKMYLAANPVCVDPGSNHPGRVVAATEVHHIKPKADGGSDEESNLSSVCKSCHSKLTATERQRKRTDRE